MASIFEKFDKQIDTKGLKEDIKSASTNDFVDVPTGDYEVKVAKAELKESKSGKPMLSVWFKILSGEFKGQTIFMNQVVMSGFQFHIANDFIRSLDFDIDFENYVQYAEAIEEFAEAVQDVEFALEYGENSKGFSTYKVTEIFE